MQQHVQYLSLTLPGFDENGNPGVVLSPPPGIPTGGFMDATGNLLPFGNTLLSQIMTLIFALAIILALGYTIWGGIQWISSQGDKQKVAAARSKIIYAIIGIFLIFLAITVVNLILFFFKQPQFGS